MTRYMAHISLSSIQLLNYTRHTVAQLTLCLSRTDVVIACKQLSRCFRYGPFAECLPDRACSQSSIPFASIAQPRTLHLINSESTKPHCHND